MDLFGKVALVTGASKGIGAAIADLLRARGVRLALAALPEPGFEAHASPDSLVIPSDLTADDFCDALVQQCASKFALHAVNDSLRRELAGDGIHVMKLCPGIVATGFRDHVLAGKAPGGVEQIRRVVTPRQIAQGVMLGMRRRKHTVYVPWLSRLFMAVDFAAPRVMDWYCRCKSQ